MDSIKRIMRPAFSNFSGELLYLSNPYSQHSSTYPDDNCSHHQISHQQQSGDWLHPKTN